MKRRPNRWWECARCLQPLSASELEALLDHHPDCKLAAETEVVATQAAAERFEAMSREDRLAALFKGDVFLEMMVDLDDFDLDDPEPW